MACYMISPPQPRENRAGEKNYRVSRKKKGVGRGTGTTSIFFQSKKRSSKKVDTILSKGLHFVKTYSGKDVRRDLN